MTVKTAARPGAQASPNDDLFHGPDAYDTFDEFIAELPEPETVAQAPAEEINLLSALQGVYAEALLQLEAEAPPQAPVWEEPEAPPPPPPISRIDSSAPPIAEIAIERPASAEPEFVMTMGKLEEIRRLRKRAQEEEAANPTQFKPPSSEALSVWFRSLAVLYRSGVKVNRAFELLAEQSECKHMAAISRDIGKRVYEGSNLAQATAAHEASFSRLQVRLFHLGERTGTLHNLLERMAVYEEKRRQVTLQVKGALVYPAFLFAMSFLMLITVPPFLFQGIFQMIGSSGVEPPLLTKLVVGFANFVRTPPFWIGLFGTFAGFYSLVKLISTQPHLKGKLDSLVLKVPMLGRVYRILAVARFARALALQIEVGENMATAVKLAAESSDHAVLEWRIQRAVEGLTERGDTLVRALTRTDFFPRPFLHILAAGEETGELERMVSKMAEIYEDELQSNIETFLAMLEPMMMMFLGILVGIIVIATMMPMMQLLQTMH